MNNYEQIKSKYKQLKKREYSQIFSNEDITQENKEILIYGSLEFLEKCIENNRMYYEGVIEYEEVYSLSLEILIELINVYNEKEYFRTFLQILEYRICAAIKKSVEYQAKFNKVNRTEIDLFPESLESVIENKKYCKFVAENGIEHLIPRRKEIVCNKFGLYESEKLDIKELSEKFGCGITRMYFMLDDSYEQIYEFIKKYYPEDFKYFEENSEEENLTR